MLKVGVKSGPTSRRGQVTGCVWHSSSHRSLDDELSNILSLETALQIARLASLHSGSHFIPNSLQLKAKLAAATLIVTSCHSSSPRPRFGPSFCSSHMTIHGSFPYTLVISYCSHLCVLWHRLCTSSGHLCRIFAPSSAHLCTSLHICVHLCTSLCIIVHLCNPGAKRGNPGTKMHKDVQRWIAICAPVGRKNFPLIDT